MIRIIKRSILLISSILLILFQLGISEKGDSQCQQELEQLFIDQQIVYECLDNTIVIKGQNKLSLSINLADIALTSLILIQDINTLNIFQLILKNCQLKLPGDQYTFITITNIQSLTFDEILSDGLDLYGYSSLLSIQQIQSLSINLYGIKLRQLITKEQSQMAYNEQSLQKIELKKFVEISANEIYIGQMIIYFQFQYPLNIYPLSSLKIKEIEIDNELNQNINIINCQTAFFIQKQALIDTIGFKGGVFIEPASKLIASFEFIMQDSSKLQIKNIIVLQCNEFKGILFFNVFFQEQNDDDDDDAVEQQSLNFNTYEPQNVKVDIDKIIFQSDKIKDLGVSLISFNSITDLTINEILIDQMAVSFFGFIGIYGCNNVSINTINVISKTMVGQNQIIHANKIANLIINSINMEKIELFDEFIKLNSTHTVINNFTVKDSILRNGIISAYSSDSIMLFKNTIINTQINTYAYLFQDVNYVEMADIIVNKIRGSSDEQVFDSNFPPSYLVEINTVQQFILKNIDITLNYYQFGWLLSIDLVSLVISNSKLRNGFSQYQGGLMQMCSSSKQIVTQLNIQKSSFESSWSNNFGGCIFGGEIKLIEDVTFRNCSSGVGGALYLSSNSSAKELSKINFLDNKAYIHQEDYSLGIDSIVVDQTYQFNPQFESTPLYLLLVETTDLFYKGMSYIFKLKFKINDKFYPLDGQSIKPLNMYQYLVNNDNFLLMPINQINTPYLTAYLDGTKNGFSEINLVILNLKINIKLNKLPSFQCSTNMEQVFLSQYQSTQFICKYCEISKSLQVSSTTQEDKLSTSLQSINQEQKCQTCNPSYFSMCYANYSSLRQGFWRDIYSINASDIEECSISPMSCIGGYDIQNVLCSEGHIGPQCLNCDIKGQYWNASYSKYGSFQCSKCNSISNNTIKISVLLIVLSVSVAIIIVSNFKNLKNHIFAQYLSQMNMVYFGRSLYEQNLTSVYIKILFFNLSVYSISNGFTNIDVFNSIKKISVTISDPISTQILSLDCLLVQFYPDLSSIGFATMVLAILVPTILFLIVALFILFLFLIKKIISKKALYMLFLSFQYIFVIIFNATILNLCLESFACLRLYKEDTYSILDLSLTCYGNDEISVIRQLSIPVFVFVVNLFPLYIFSILFKQRKNLTAIRTMLSFGFFYKEYQTKYFYWEFIRLILKMILVSTSIAFKQYILISGIIMTLQIFVYYSAIQRLKPFKLSNLNKLEKISVSLSILILQTSLMFQQFSNSDTSSILTFVKIIYIISQVLCMIFILSLLVLIVVSFSQKQILKIYQKYKWRYLKYLIPSTLLNIMRINKNYKKIQKCVQLIKNNSQKQSFEIELSTQKQIESSDNLMEK